MLFSASDIVLSGVVAPLAIVLFISVLSISLSFSLGRRKKPLYAVLAPIIIWGTLLIMGLITFADGLTYPISVLIQPHAEKRETIGEVTAIRDAPIPLIYYSPNLNTFDSASIVTVNGNEYYIVQHQLQVGQYVNLVWSTDKRVVFSWSILPQYEPETYGGESSNYQKEQVISPPNFVTNANPILLGSFLIIVVVTILQYPLGKAISSRLEKIDRRHSGSVVPNRFGLLIYATILCPITGVLIGLSLEGYSGVWLIGLLAFVSVFRIILVKQTTTVQIVNDSLYYRKLGSEHYYEICEIVSVQWGSSQIPHNRSLVITFSNHFSLALEQENYWGIENMYSELCSLVETQNKT